MSSSIQFQDPNLPPEPSSFTISFTAAVTPTATTAPLLRPKIEPKTEPLDEEPLLQPPVFTFTPTWQPDPVPRSTALPFSDPGQLVSGESPAPEAVSTPDTSNVFSEFARISKLFNAAFCKTEKRDGEVVDELDTDSGAIVPVAAETTVESTGSARSCKRQKRKLMRCTLFPDAEHFYDKERVRNTRLVYNSLRVFSLFEVDKRLGPGKRRTERADLRAATLMKDRDLWLHCDKKVVGSIPGITVGDVFFYRMEMCVVGLHGQPQAGIDYLISSESENGCPVATSIIVSGGYEDDEDSGDVLIYSGHGGRDKNNKPCCDQKPEGGNLALLKSMEYGFEVRVIRGVKGEGIKVYVYDGLYKIVESWLAVGKSGFSVYKYKLVRIEGQEKMGSSQFGLANTLRIKPLEVRPNGYLTLDLSLKKEIVSVFLFNDIDSDHGPLYFEYLPKTVLPSFLYQTSANTAGCECVAGCSDSCLCAIKNGGEIPYDYNGFLVRGKPLIFECGPNCMCPPSCRNRVSQKGLRHRMEVYKSKESRWRVRTLDLIHAGSFICEYSGVVLSRDQAQVLSMSGDNLVYPGRFTPKWMEWGDLSKVYPDYSQPSHPSLPPLDFAMDVSSMRNVAFYMGRSVLYPNVMAQFVLYDHNNLMFPRIMLYAMEAIPPMIDLTVDYGMPDDHTGKPAICHR